MSSLPARNAMRIRPGDGFTRYRLRTTHAPAMQGHAVALQSRPDVDRAGLTSRITPIVPDP